MAYGMSSTYVDKILNAVLRNTSFTPPTQCYVSLHTGDPGYTGANECTGGSYARQAISFAAPSGSCPNRQVALSASPSFTLMPACTVTHIGIWDALAGAYITGTVLTASKTVNSGDTFTLSTETFGLN